MTISWLSLFWLFFFYSFIGWCIEVCSAAVQHRKFVNRGFVAGPLCPIYGFGAVFPMLHRGRTYLDTPSDKRIEEKQPEQG
jgi:uncharacterized membrane protein